MVPADWALPGPPPNGPALAPPCIPKESYSWRFVLSLSTSYASDTSWNFLSALVSLFTSG